MKLRIKGDSIRLRLTQSEVAAIGAGDAVTEVTHFPGGEELRYSLVVRDTMAMSVSLVDRDVAVSLPRQLARDWATNFEVSLHGAARVAGGELTLLVEKDFECLDPRGAGQDADAFPNPKRASKQ